MVKVHFFSKQLAFPEFELDSEEMFKLIGQRSFSFMAFDLDKTEDSLENTAGEFGYGLFTG